LNDDFRRLRHSATTSCDSEDPVTDSRSAGHAELEERVFSVKKRFLAMYKRAHAGHIGSSLSCAEILVFLKYAWMRDEDTFILSKGHAVAALYALLAEANAFDPRELDTFYEDGTRFPALPPINTLAEIPFATGSLGHGLSLCAGMALGAILNRREERFFCLTSDGELDEGSTWEAALFVAHRRLTNVVWLIDRNRIQAIGGTEEVLALEPLDAKLEAFGFHVISADGHDFPSLLAARDQCTHALASQASQANQGRPLALIFNTVKGHGIRYMEDKVASHFLPMDDAQYSQALNELEIAHAAALAGARDAG
jgi:transketolase